MGGQELIKCVQLVHELEPLQLRHLHLNSGILVVACGSFMCMYWSVRLRPTEHVFVLVRST